MAVPDPSSYADQFAERVAAWKERAPGKLASIQDALRRAQRERAWDETIILYNTLTKMMEEQVQVNAMVVAALDELKKGMR